MNTWEWVVVGVIALMVAVSGLSIMSRRVTARHGRTRSLQERFGDEYTRTVQAHRRKAGERELEGRLAAHEDLDLQRLTPATRSAHTEAWRDIQYGFVDSPTSSVREAEHLAVAIMGERGYPTEDFEGRVAALSVDDPELAGQYRAAFGTYQLAEAGSQSLEVLLEAVLTYRTLVEALLARPTRETGLPDTTAPELVEEPDDQAQQSPPTGPDPDA